MDAVECVECREPVVKHKLCRTCLGIRRDLLAEEIRELKQRLVLKQSQLEDLA